MNQKKAKALRRSMRAIHGRTKSKATALTRYQALKTISVARSRRIFRNELSKLILKIKKMGAKVNRIVLIKRAAKNVPVPGTTFVITATRLVADEPRQAYQTEKKFYKGLSKKRRAGMYGK